ncbi:MAG: pilus assembly protein TadB [Lachnospiraceae bacterium]|nr:pilus assembly protein TadB [Lachnospiraceae bacterium]
MRDYHRYRYSLHEHLRYFLEALFLILLVSYLFYHSLIAILLMIPFYPVFLKIKAKRLLQQQKQELGQQFKETIAAVAAALNAGYSVENAWREAKTEMEQMYGAHALMVQELGHIQIHLSMNVALEELLNDFARRSDMEDVSSFCQVFFFAKRSGGDFIGIIRATADRIGQKIELQRQLMADLAARRLESQIMNIVPLVILLYLNLTSPGYFDVLYGNLTGICIMSVCLMIYLAAYALSEHMLQQILAI